MGLWKLQAQQHCQSDERETSMGEDLIADDQEDHNKRNLQAVTEESVSDSDSDSDSEGSSDMDTSSSRPAHMHESHHVQDRLEWPLATAGPIPSPLDSFTTANDLWFVQVILLVVGFLHTKHHMSFRACGILLWCLRSVFILIGLFNEDNRMPTTLGTTFTHLGFVDRFTLLVVCPECRAVAGTPITSPCSEEETLCTNCNASLYSGIPPTYFVSDPAARPIFKKVKPKIAVPFASLRDLLAEPLARPGLEGLIDAWRTQCQAPGKYAAIWDGHIWKTIRDADGCLFFSAREDNELRIAATCGLDW